MSSARHFFKVGTLSDDALKTDIKDDISASREAQLALDAAGQTKAAALMGNATDDALDELNAANNGTWRPKHA
ncbi:hypothetical protein ABZX77_17855 [Streptomyces sp. NPDC004237]|uniref:hypothetical protein n=1 Tax=Streptomyces sp. NPDC004237 TaxID=3154455 RepID=UPI0033B16558